jgi:BASS family bile acid:Na+ symporter
MIEKLILPMSLALLMCGLGMSLQISDFSRVAKRWRVVTVALGSIFVAMPTFAYLIGHLLRLDVALIGGLLLLATCPGGMFSNMVTHSSEGDVALSISLTICSSLIYAAALPLTMLVWIGRAPSGETFPVPMLKMFIELLAVVLIPISIGMAMRRWYPAWCSRRESMIRKVSSLLIVIVFLFLATQQFRQFVNAGVAIFTAVLLLNLAAWTMALLVVAGFRLSKREFIAIGAEHSIRQEGLGVFVAVTVLGNANMVAPLLMNSFTGFFVSVAFVALLNSRMPFPRAAHDARVKSPRIIGKHHDLL